MTEPRRVDEPHRGSARRPNLGELARETGLKPIESLEDLEALAIDVWDSDEDLQAFLADIRRQPPRRSRLSARVPVVVLDTDGRRSCIGEAGPVGLGSLRVERDNEAMPRTGDTVRIAAGRMEGFVGRIASVDNDAGTVRVLVRLFGRESGVEVPAGVVVRVQPVPTKRAVLDRRPDPTSILDAD